MKRVLIKLVTIASITILPQYGFGKVGPSSSSSPMNEVFTDSQFTASPYGRHVARNCLNPKVSSAQFRFNSFPGSGPSHFARDRRNIQPLWRFTATQKSDGKIAVPYIKRASATSRPRPQRYFNAALESGAKEVFLFLGVNEVSSNVNVRKARVKDAVRLVDRIVASGKKCTYGLPPLYRGGTKKVNARINKLNPKIIKFNRILAPLIAGKCRVLDPSNTLSKNTSRHKKFYTVDGLHFSTEGSKVAAKATCLALRENKPRQNDYQGNDSGSTFAQAMQDSKIRKEMTQNQRTAEAGVSYANISLDTSF